MPAKLSTRVRAMSTGHGRKTDPTDARAVAIGGLRNPTLTHVTVDDETVALRLLSERRRDLVRSRTQAISRLHQVLMELIPSGAPRNLTASRAQQLLATVRPRDVAGKARESLTQRRRQVALSYDVFQVAPKPIPSSIPGFEDQLGPATWPPSTATFIWNQDGGLLVDALITQTESELLAKWVAGHDGPLTTVYVTHPHADHFLGLPAVLAASPDAKAFALPGAIRLAGPSVPGCHAGVGRLLPISAPH